MKLPKILLSEPAQLVIFGIIVIVWTLFLGWLSGGRIDP